MEVTILIMCEKVWPPPSLGGGDVHPLYIAEEGPSSSLAEEVVAPPLEGGGHPLNLEQEVAILLTFG